MDYNAGKSIGPSFAGESAGLTDRRFAWGVDGRFSIDDAMAASAVAALKAIIAAHDPTLPLAAAEIDARNLAHFDGEKLAKALAIWTAQKLGVSLATARAEILAIYKGF